MRNFWQNKKMYIINTLIILITFITVLIISHMSPFGNSSLGKSDAIVIFKPMLFDFGLNKFFDYNTTLFILHI